MSRPKPKRACVKCEFYEIALSQCQFFPPAVDINHLPQPRPEQAFFRPIFPVVAPDTWCGQFQHVKASERHAPA